MKKGFLVTLVFAGWFLIKSQQLQQLVFGKQTMITNTGHKLNEVANLFFQQAKAERQLPPLPTMHLQHRKFCLKTIVHMPLQQEQQRNNGEETFYPLTPVLIHSL
jgi:hypothetical protein